MRVIRCHTRRFIGPCSSWAFGKNSLAYLRRTRAMRRSRHHTQKTPNRPNRRYRLHQRTPCHGGGSGGTRSLGRGPAVWQQEQSDATLVRRQSLRNATQTLRQGHRDCHHCTDQERFVPQELYKSLTWDRGKEMADHKSFTLATDIQVYFCDPHHPWRQG